MKGGERKKKGGKCRAIAKVRDGLYVMQDIRLPSLTSGEREGERKRVG